MRWEYESLLKIKNNNWMVENFVNLLNPHEDFHVDRKNE